MTGGIFYKFFSIKKEAAEGGKSDIIADIILLPKQAKHYQKMRTQKQEK